MEKRRKKPNMPDPIEKFKNSTKEDIDREREAFNKDIMETRRKTSPSIKPFEEQYQEGGPLNVLDEGDEAVRTEGVQSLLKNTVDPTSEDVKIYEAPRVATDIVPPEQPLIPSGNRPGDTQNLGRPADIFKELNEDERMIQARSVLDEENISELVREMVKSKPYKNISPLKDDLIENIVERSKKYLVAHVVSEPEDYSRLHSMAEGFVEEQLRSVMFMSGDTPDNLVEGRQEIQYDETSGRSRQETKLLPVVNDSKPKKPKKPSKFGLLVGLGVAGLISAGAFLYGSRGNESDSEGKKSSLENKANTVLIEKTKDPRLNKTEFTYPADSERLNAAEKKLNSLEQNVNEIKGNVKLGMKDIVELRTDIKANFNEYAEGLKNLEENVKVSLAQYGESNKDFTSGLTEIISKMNSGINEIKNAQNTQKAIDKVIEKPKVPLGHPLGLDFTEGETVEESYWEGRAEFLDDFDRAMYSESLFNNTKTGTNKSLESTKKPIVEDKLEAWELGVGVEFGVTSYTPGFNITKLDPSLMVRGNINLNHKESGMGVRLGAEIFETGDTQTASFGYLKAETDAIALTADFTVKPQDTLLTEEKEGLALTSSVYMGAEYLMENVDITGRINAKEISETRSNGEFGLRFGGAVGLKNLIMKGDKLTVNGGFTYYPENDGGSDSRTQATISYFKAFDF